ncbi:MAG: hypothetical protein IKC46_07405 [Lachnospiraceae bacterium]|nr:hypothetical protein [Lachnospiraceae bacterium]
MKKRKKKRHQPTALFKEFMPVLFAAVLVLCVINRIFLHEFLTVSGQAYFNIALQWYLLFLTVGAGGMFHAVSRMVSLRTERGNTRNAKLVVRSAFTLSVCMGLFLALLLYLAADVLAGKISGLPVTVSVLKCLSVSVFPFCVAVVFLGGLDGFGFENTSLFCMELSGVLFLVSSYITCGRLKNYGDKVGALLQNPEYGPSYAALGLAVSVAVTSWFCLIVSFIAWLSRKRMIHTLALHESGAAETQAAVTRGIVSARGSRMLLLGLPVLILILQQEIYRFFGKPETASYIQDWGVLTGTAGTCTALLVLCAAGFAIRQIPGMKLCFESRNLKKCRNKLMTSMRAMAVMIFPLSVYTAVLAKNILGMLFGENAGADMAVLRISSVSVIFLAAALVLGCALWCMHHEKIVILGISISGVIILLIQYLLLQFGQAEISVLCWAVLMGMILLSALYLTAVTRLEKIRANWIAVFLAPVIGTLLSALVCWFMGVFLSKTLPDTMTCIISILVSGIFYLVTECVLHGIDARVLQEYPGGRTIYVVLHQLRLM